VLKIHYAFLFAGIRVLIPQFYCNAATGKYQLMQDPRLLVSWAMDAGSTSNVSNQKQPSMAMFAHPVRQDAHQEMAVEKQVCPNSRCSNARSKDHLKSLARVEDLYKKAAFPPGTGLLDSAVLVKKNSVEMQRFDCLMWSMSHNTTARDQVLFHYLIHRMKWQKGKEYVMHPNTCLLKVVKYVGHMHALR
jgi:hypothetical protein